MLILVGFGAAQLETIEGEKRYITPGMKPLLLCGEEQKYLQGQVSLASPFLSVLETPDTVNNAAFRGVGCGVWVYPERTVATTEDFMLWRNSGRTHMLKKSHSQFTFMVLPLDLMDFAAPLGNFFSLPSTPTEGLGL